MTSKVNGKTGILTPCRSETPESFITKLDILIILLGATCAPNFMGIGPGVPAPQKLKYNVLCLCVPLLPFPSLSFPFLFSCHQDSCAYQGVLKVGLLNDVRQIPPRPTPVATQPNLRQNILYLNLYRKYLQDPCT